MLIFYSIRWAVGRGKHKEDIPLIRNLQHLHKKWKIFKEKKIWLLERFFTNPREHYDF